MQKIRAAIFRRPHEPLTIESIDIDAPVGRELLIRTVACGICHSDYHFLDGHMSMATAQMPNPVAVLGHEPAGIVEAVGPEVKLFKPGDRVVGCLSGFCGNCPQCFSGNPARCEDKASIMRRPGNKPRLSQKGEPLVQFATLGAFAEKMLVHENSIVKVADDIPLELAALLGCGVLTGVGAALNTAKVTAGSTVAVFGCGGIGCSVIQGARLAGARVVVGVDLRKEKLALAKRMGATHTVDASAGDAVKAIRTLVPRGVDYAFEAVGQPSLVPQLLDSLVSGGTATLVGVMPTTSEIRLGGWSLFQEKKLQACSMGSNRFRIDIPKLVDFYRDGALDLAGMVGKRFTLDRINDGFAELKTGDAARSVIVFES